MISIVNVTGHSMAPTVQPGERLLAVTARMRWGLRRGQIVTLCPHNLIYPLQVLDRPESLSWRAATSTANQQSDLYLKRIVGLPFDIIRVPTSEASSFSPVDLGADKVGADYVWHVPEHHVFVRGDGVFSVDSVTWGPVPIFTVHQIILCRFPSFKRVG